MYTVYTYTVQSILTKAKKCYNNLTEKEWSRGVYMCREA